MRRLCCSMMVFVLGGLAALSCGQGQGPGAAVSSTVAATKVALSPKAGWEGKWEGILASARKEGVVSIYSGWGPATRTALMQAFKEKYGINAEFTAFGRGAEVLARVQTEKRAGLYISDVFGVGGITLVATMKPEGLLGPMETLIILPEVLDPRVWLGDKFPWYDKDKLVIGMVSSLNRGIIYNNTMIKEGELASYEDLLKPQYKGKIVLADPSVAGGGNAIFTLLTRAWNVERTGQFLTRLLKEQEAVMTRDPRQQVEWVARGKYAIAFGLSPDIVADFMSAGSPISQGYPKEGIVSSPAAGSMAVPTVSAHPNAAIVFVNWLLTKEGQAVFSKSWGSPSVRVDVPAGTFDPSFMARPGEKIEFASEEFAILQGDMVEVARKVVEQANR